MICDKCGLDKPDDAFEMARGLVDVLSRGTATEKERASVHLCDECTRERVAAMPPGVRAIFEKLKMRTVSDMLDYSEHGRHIGDEEGARQAREALVDLGFLAPDELPPPGEW